MKPEQKFYQWLRKFLPPDHVRVESPLSPGLPDLNLAYKGVEAWIELKCPLQGDVILRKEQYAWGTRRANSGGRVFVLCECSKNVEQRIIAWRYPFQVIPWGNGGKYVQIADMRHFKIHAKDLEVSLKSMLFSDEFSQFTI